MDLLFLHYVTGITLSVMSLSANKSTKTKITLMELNHIRAVAFDSKNYVQMQTDVQKPYRNAVKFFLYLHSFYHHMSR